MLSAKQNNPSQPVSITQQNQSNTIELLNSEDYNHVRVNKLHAVPLRGEKEKTPETQYPLSGPGFHY